MEPSLRRCLLEYCEAMAQSGPFATYNHAGYFDEVMDAGGAFRSEYQLVAHQLSLLGTDELGRDIHARVAHGARFSLAIAGLTTLVYGLIEAPTRGWTDGLPVIPHGSSVFSAASGWVVTRRPTYSPVAASFSSARMI